MTQPNNNSPPVSNNGSSSALEDFMKKNPAFSGMMSAYLQQQYAQQSQFQQLMYSPYLQQPLVDYNQAPNISPFAQNMFLPPVPIAQAEQTPIVQEIIEPSPAATKVESKEAELKNEEPQVVKNNPEVIRKLAEKLAELRKSHQPSSDMSCSGSEAGDSQPTVVVEPKVDEVNAEKLRDDLEEKKLRETEEFERKKREECVKKANEDERTKRLTLMKKQLEVMQKQLLAEEEKFDELNSKIANYHETSTEIVKSMQDMMKKIASMQTLLQRNQERLAENQKKLVELSTESSECAMALSSKRKMVSELNSDIVALETGSVRSDSPLANVSDSKSIFDDAMRQTPIEDKPLFHSPQHLVSDSTPATLPFIPPVPTQQPQALCFPPPMNVNTDKYPPMMAGGMALNVPNAPAGGYPHFFPNPYYANAMHWNPAVYPTMNKRNKTNE